MRPRQDILRNPRVTMIPPSNGIDAVKVRTREGVLYCLFSADEDGWEHVSVSPIKSVREGKAPYPTWGQMCEVKDVFWDKEEGVVQFHPPESHYVHGVGGTSTNILHLWKPADNDWSRLGWDNE